MKQGWEIKKLGEVCNIYQPKTISGEMLIEDGKYLVYGANGIIGRYDEYNHENSEVLLTCRGATCGSINVSKPYSWINGNAMVVQPKNDNIAKVYLQYLLKAVDWSKVITGAAQPQITRQSLSPLEIHIPPLPIQEKIVAELDCLSGVIEKKKQQLKELDSLAESIFYTMFGDPITNEKGWKIIPLSNKVKVKGRVGWKGYKKEDLRDSGPLAIGGGHLTDNGGIDISNPVYLSMEKYLESPEIMIEVGDIILVQRGTIGKVGLIANSIGEATINPCVLILRPDNLSSVYLLHFFLNASTQMHLKTLIKGVAQPMITQQQVNELSLPIPPLTLQQEFAEKIEAIEKQKELIKKSITETETLFNARMQYYFG